MKAAISEKEPFLVKVEEGKSYFWCSCGQSTKQPLCDGSHKGTSFLPLKYVATENKDIYLFVHGKQSYFLLSDCTIWWNILVKF